MNSMVAQGTKYIPPPINFDGTPKWDIMTSKLHRRKWDSAQLWLMLVTAPVSVGQSVWKLPGSPDPQLHAFSILLQSLPHSDKYDLKLTGDCATAFITKICGKSLCPWITFKTQEALWNGKGLHILEEWFFLLMTSRSMLDPKPQSQDLVCIYTLSLSELIGLRGLK